MRSLHGRALLLSRWAGLIGALLLGATSARAQELGAVAGTVLDSASATPLATVLIEIRVPGSAAIADGVTGPGGAFRIGNVPPGTYAVQFLLPGWRTIAVSEESVSAGETTYLHVVMPQHSYTLNPITVTASRKEEKVLDAPAAAA